MDDNVRLDGLLGERAGVGRLALGASGTVALAGDGGPTLHVAAGEGPDEALLYPGLPAVRPDQERATWRRLLEANAALPAGTALAVHPQAAPGLIGKVTGEGMALEPSEDALGEALAMLA